MKRILFLLGIIASIGVSAQVSPPAGFVGINSKANYIAIFGDSNTNIAYRDTIIAPLRIGETRLRPQDTTLYVAKFLTGKKWYTFGNSGGVSASDKVDSVTLGSSALVDTVKYWINGTSYVAGYVDKKEGLLNGGIVTWSGTGLTFDVTGAIYVINGSRYTSIAGSVTLTAADPDNPRIDVIALDDNGDIVTVTGEAAASPSTPQIDPSTQIYLTSVLIAAGGTTPSDIGTTVIYDENTEWTGSSSALTADFANTSTVYNGSKSAKITLLSDGSSITFTNGSTVDRKDYSAVKLFVNQVSTIYLGNSGRPTIYVSFLNGSTVVSNEVKASSFDSHNQGVYQNISIPISDFTFTSDDFDKVKITFRGTSNGYYVDYVQLQNGISPTPLGGGIKSLNGSSGENQTFAGVNIGINTVGDVHTFTIDTTLLSTKANVWKVVDSAMANVSAGGITQVVAGNGLTNVNDSTLKVDTAIVATKLRVKEVADSLGALIGTGITQPQLDDSTTALRTDLATNSALQDTAAAIRADMGIGSVTQTQLDDSAAAIRGDMVVTDTTSLSNRINQKLNISDTSSMLTGYVRGQRLTDSLLLKQRKVNYSDSSLKISNDSLFFRDYVNIKSFGAVPDGSTDNSTALANAIATGRPVFIPTGGTFNYSTGITLNTGQVIFGLGEKSQLKYTGTGRAITVGDSSKVVNFRLDGNGKTSGHPFETGVFFLNKLNAVVQDMLIVGFGGDPVANGGGGIFVAQIAASNSEGDNIINCRVLSCKVGINMKERGEYVNILGGTIANCTTGAAIGAGNFSVTGTVFENNVTGIKFYSGTNNGHGSITSCLINHSTYNIDVQDISYATGITFGNCQFYFGSLFFKNANNIRFSNCNFGSIDSVHIDNSFFLTRSNCTWGKTGASAIIPIKLYNGSLGFETTGDSRPDATTPSNWIYQQYADTLSFKGPMYHTGTTPSSSSSSDSVWVKDATTGQWKLRAQSSIGGGSFSKAITIESPTSSENIGMFYTDVAITVTKLAEALRGTSPSVTYNINHSTDRSSGSPNLLFSSDRAATSTTGTTTTTFNDATIPAGSWVWLTTSATSGTISSINITLIYTKD